jgi:hypothetical protein
MDRLSRYHFSGQRSSGGAIGDQTSWTDSSRPSDEYFIEAL